MPNTFRVTTRQKSSIMPVNEFSDIPKNCVVEDNCEIQKLDGNSTVTLWKVQKN
jgi:hypothetical protein